LLGRGCGSGATWFEGDLGVRSWDGSGGCGGCGWG